MQTIEKEEETSTARSQNGKECENQKTKHALWRVIGYRNLPVCKISLPEVQVRMDPKITADFVNQVELGIIEPVIVRRLKKQRCEIVSGGGVRRFLAANECGSREIKCEIVEVEEENSWRIALLENTREDLSPMDLAGYIDQIMKKHQISQNEIAKMLGKEKSTLSNLLRVFHNAILREEVMAGFHSVQTAIELESIAPKEGATREEMERFMSFVNKTRDLTVRQIRSAIIRDFMGKRLKRRCNRCRVRFAEEELCDLKICSKCRKSMGLEMFRRSRLSV